MCQKVFDGLISLAEQDESGKDTEPKDLPSLSEKNYRFIDSTPVLMCSLDREGLLKYSNKAFETAIESTDDP
ncbi:MAG TPA: hypothetical protein VGK23_01850, partial [Methanomassiliicoccales archaeon]